MGLLRGDTGSLDYSSYGVRKGYSFGGYVGVL